MYANISRPEPSHKYQPMTRRAGCVIYHGGEFLMVHHPASGYWGFPKGRLNPDETPENGAMREVHEETGVVLTRDQLGKMYRCKDSKYYVVHLDARPPVFVDRVEVDGYMWTHPNNARSLATSTVTKLVLEKIKREGTHL